MRFLANENFPGDAVRALRARAHDVAWIRTDNPGSSDQEVLARAMREHRVLVTFDKDFGELAWKAGLPAECGIVLFPAARQLRATGRSPGQSRQLERPFLRC